MTETLPVPRPAVHPLPADILEAVREAGADVSGRPLSPFRDADGGLPLRCCLRDSAVGERVALISWAPLRAWAAERGVDPGPYDEVGPVFVHADRCAGGRTADGVPAMLRSRRVVLRAYSPTGAIDSAVVVEPGGDLAAAAAGLLADPGVAVLHARSLTAGCFLAEITSGG